MNAPRREFVVERVIEQFEGSHLLELVRYQNARYLRRFATDRVKIYARVTKRLVDRYINGTSSIQSTMYDLDTHVLVEIDSSKPDDVCFDYVRVPWFELPPTWLPEERHTFYDPSFAPR